MRTRHFCILLAVLLGSMSRAGVTAQVPSPHRAHPPLAAPVLMHTCLITRDVARLVAFYREVLRTPAVMEGSEYAEFRTGVGVLAIFSAAAQERYFPGETEPASSRGVILEFEVADVDQEYARLKPLVKEWVEPPTRQPWGTRSMHFRDPDGNLVDFYMRVNG